MRYIHYCQPGTPFYMPPGETDSSPRLDAHRALPSGWARHETRPWTMCWKEPRVLPRQGWKIHLSATVDNRVRVLDQAFDYCVSRELAFKFLSTEADFASQNSKYADRTSAGKFITIYPSDVDEFRAALTDLEAAIGAEKGPYILSDRRWGTGPIFFRYGAFERPSAGSPYVSTLIDPSGAEVEDVRRPTFTLPDWVELPDFLSSETSDMADADFPFEMLSALHFSSGGGVYLARATSDQYVPHGTQVVLKEARPYAAIDPDGRDAITRLHHEIAALKELEDTGCVPRCYGAFQAWEHHYAVLEHLDGHDLKREWMLRTPVLKPAPWNLRDDDYLDWLTSTIEQLDTALTAIHRRGWLLGDIHPKNIIMVGGRTPKFIDLEFSGPMDPGFRTKQGAPGYEPAPGLVGEAADLWSLGIMELDLIHLQATITDQGNEVKIDEILTAGRRDLGVSREICETIRSKTLGSRDPHVPPSTSTSHRMTALAAGVQKHITFPNDGPAVPADIAVFQPDGEEAQLSYPHGLVGVLAALTVAGTSIPGDTVNRAVHWIRDRLPAIRSRGLKGSDGIQYGLRQIGFHDLAETVRRLHLDQPTDHTYWSGWAGAGLNALDEPAAQGDVIMEASEALQRMLDAAEPAESAGLLHGWSGPAVFWANAYTRFRPEPIFLDLAHVAIERDLERCTETVNDTLEYDEQWRTLPYLATGSTGVALAIGELNAATDGHAFRKQQRQLHKAATYNQCGHAGYAHGLAGFLAYLNRFPSVRDIDGGDVIRSHLDALDLHTVRVGDESYVRGNQNLRLSCDFLTGSAGVLGTLAALEGRWSGFPFLPQREVPRNERR